MVDKAREMLIIIPLIQQDRKKSNKKGHLPQQQLTN